jgi:hypothetical protein
MISYLYCIKCSRGFGAELRKEHGDPQDHRYELLGSDLKKTDYGRAYVACAFDDCSGSLEDFSWWKEVRAQAKQQGIVWPEEPIYAVKYQLKNSHPQTFILSERENHIGQRKIDRR